MITKETAMTTVEKGWHHLLEMIYDTIPSRLQLHPSPEVEHLDRRYGMLYFKYHRHETYSDVDTIILAAVENKIERISAITCEKCGQRGVRIKEELPACQCLCIVCYSLVYSDLHPEPQLAVNKQPILDY